MREFDAVVVGGGPAGSSCAAELLRAGFSVAVLDKAVFPRDKLCAGWIPPSTFRLIGVEPDAYPHGIREYRSLHLRLKGFPLPVPTRQYAIRRYEFDAWLIERAGADLFHHRVRRIERLGGEKQAGGRQVVRGSATGGEKPAAGPAHTGGRFVIDGEFSCRYLIGAGGTGCPVGRWLRGGGRHGGRPGAGEEQARPAEGEYAAPHDGSAECDRPAERNRPADGNLIVTMEEEFPYPVEDESCYLRFFDRGILGYSWYFPKADGFLTVGIGGKQRELKRQGRTIREHWEAFTAHLEKRGLVTGRRFSPAGHSYYLRGTHPLLGYDGVLLVGDAARLATVDFGEGIEPALHSGLLAARSIVDGEAYTVENVKRKSLPDILRPEREKSGDQHIH